jgi:predicted NACHT family NTPase
MSKILGLFAVPAATCLSFLQAWSKDHPAPALLALAVYELVVLGFGFVSKLVSGTADELNKRWKDPLAKSIDEGTRRRLSGYGSRYRRSVISNLRCIGAPGCGKTTLLRHTALLVCQTRRRRRIPVLLYLRDHIRPIADDTPLPDLIDQQNRRQLSDWVERQVASYPDNDFVIASRPHGYQTAPIAGADIVQVRAFTDEQVTRFIRSRYFAFEQRSTGEKSANIARRAEEEATDLLERLQHSTAL